MALNYTNPGWTNDDEPYIDADNLNDISDNLEEACDLIGNETMGTTATTITGSIKELVERLGSTVIGTVGTTITSAIKALQDKIGSTVMGTTATTITGAIKEVKDSVDSTGTNIFFRNDNTPIDVSNNSTAALISLMIPAGKWIVIGQAVFPANGNGTRRISISSASTGNALNGASADGSASISTSLFYVAFWESSETARAYLMGYQNSGSTLRIAAGGAFLRAIKLN